MFGISSFEFLMILLIGVIVLGPEKLPRVMRTFNKVMSEFRRVRTDLHRAVNLEIANQEHQERKQQAEAELLQEPKATPANTAKNAVKQPDTDAQAQAQTPAQPESAYHDIHTAQAQSLPVEHTSAENNGTACADMENAEQQQAATTQDAAPSAAANVDSTTNKAEEKATA